MEVKIRKIIMTRGIQGSGKSTWAINWVKESPTTRIRLNWDCLRNMFGEYWVPEREQLNVISDMTEAFLKDPMEYGWDIVIDNMNLSDKNWKYATSIIDYYNKYHTIYKYELEFKDFFDVTLDECIRRDSMRENPIGEAIIKKTYKTYRSLISKELNKKHVDSLVPIDKNKRNCILVDMDSTMCFNTQGRPFFGKFAAYDMCNDVKNTSVCDIVEKYIQDPNTDVIILSGREDIPEIRKATEDWLKNNINGSVDKIILRPYGIHIKGTECKYNLYKEYIEPNYNVLFVLDDSEKIVKMWRSIGLTCLQVNEGYI